MKENTILLNVCGRLILSWDPFPASIDIKQRLLIYHFIDSQSTACRFVTGPISPIWTNYLQVLTIISSPSVHDAEIEHIPWFLVCYYVASSMQFFAFFHDMIHFKYHQ